jgi:hypothetical protein
MALVSGADGNGAGGTPITSAGTTLISSLPGGIAVYEVLFSNPSAIETATVTVTVAPSGIPEKASLTALAAMAPFFDPTTGAGLASQMSSTFVSSPTSFPIPRFANVPHGPFTVYSYNSDNTPPTTTATPSGLAGNSGW